jgi:hypothetical protein
MGGYGSSKRARYSAVLHDDVLHVIFCKLGFRDKINAGLVCKDWDKLLKAGTSTSRHWDVSYNFDKIVSSNAWAIRGLAPERLIDGVGRYVSGSTL